MPIYAYQCQACGHELEAIRKISDDPLTDCPACGQATLKKQLTAPSFRLGGSGWYETDFKTGNKKNLAGEQGSPSADTAAASGASTSGASSSGSASSGVSASGTSGSDKPSTDKASASA
jgi:putative FmdB family regulatory protein